MGVEDLKVTEVSAQGVDSKKVNLGNALGKAKETVNVGSKSDKTERNGRSKETKFGIVVTMPGGVKGEYSGEVKGWDPDGEGTFVTNSGLCYQGKFENGEFHSGKINNLKTGQMIRVTHYGNGTYYGSSYLGEFEYRGQWDNRLNLYCCDYENVIINIHTAGFLRGSKHYLENQSGDMLQIQPGFDPAITAVRIAKVISIVKKSGYTLDAFENHPFSDVLQADYKGKFGDVNLLSDCPKLVGINASDLADRLNKSRKDWGI